MVQICFWLAWCLVGLGAWNSWVARACPAGGCSGMLVAMQFGGVVTPFFLWLGVGIAISIALSILRDQSRTQPPVRATELQQRAQLAGNTDSPEDADEVAMRELGVTFDGSKYRFREYRYDRVADALAYASLVKEDRAT
jgi:hypothetical protein